MRDLALMNELRRSQLEDLLGWLSPGCRVLEVGAGTGAQAASLTELGYTVTAVEVAKENATWQEYQANRLFPLTLYDGAHLPFRDGTFDVVFSSNVLEHVEDVIGLLEECARVLTPSGRMVMVMPSAVWRAWSMWPTSLLVSLKS